MFDFQEFRRFNFAFKFLFFQNASHPIKIMYNLIFKIKILQNTT
jgi:hypothetical protein